VATNPVSARPGTVEGKTFLGHPRGLFVLFFAEMWERFSYYGMRAILIFYLLQHWLFAEDKAYIIYGAYTALVYITPVIGGYLADRYIGQRKAVQFGAVLLVIGHGLMAFEGTGGQDSPYLNIFWLALAFIIMGVGFLKANISAIVGQLYGQGDPRRDPAFTIFYMGINLGAAIGSLLVGFLGQTYGWAYGFGAAGVGMLLGLIVFVWGRPTLLGRGEAPDAAALKNPVMGIPLEWMVYLSGLVGVLIVWALIQYQEVVGGLLAIFGLVVVIYLLFTAVFRLDRVDRDRILAALFLIALQPLFWALFEQAGSSLNVYTDEQVNREILGWEVPASMFQSINAIYIVLLGPVFAGLWLFLARRGLEPSTQAKFGLGLMQLGAGFLVLVAGAAAAGSGNLTPVIFIFLIYLLHTTGELCLSPVGLSAMTKLAPARMVGLMMGTWFLASAAGNFIGGLIAQATGGHGAEVEGASATPVMDVYGTIGWVAIGVGLAVIVVSPFIKRLMHEDIDNEHHDRVLAGQREIGEPAAPGIHTDQELKPGEART
jgi:proton-dependent oligopeptide transporter, POT family